MNADDVAAECGVSPYVWRELGTLYESWLEEHFSLFEDGMRIAVTGGRDFNNTDLVEYAFKQIGIGPNDTVVHGACRGADLLCATIAKLYGANTEAHPADWKRYGKSAGPVRNREMLQSGVDLLIAFPGGRGTFNAVMTAKSLDVPVWDLREMKWYSASN